MRCFLWPLSLMKPIIPILKGRRGAGMRSLPACHPLVGRGQDQCSLQPRGCFTLHGWGSTPYVSNVCAFLKKFSSEVAGV